MRPGERAVAAARDAVGTRYRLHGRAPEYGLDCVGLAGLAMRAAGYRGDIPSGYGLRGGEAAEIGALIDAALLRRVTAPASGDLLLFATGPAQFHMAVKVPGGIVHADAMLRRVVERPGPAPWPLVGAWRLCLDGDL